MHLRACPSKTANARQSASSTPHPSALHHRSPALRQQDLASEESVLSLVLESPSLQIACDFLSACLEATTTLLLGDNRNPTPLSQVAIRSTVIEIASTTSP
eukprot:4549005-Amphidinium_carterae.1